MEPTPVFSGRVNEAGEFRLDDRPAFLRRAKKFSGRAVGIVIRLRRSQRSIQQNKWLWGVALEMLVEDFGYEPNERKEAKEHLHYKLVRICFGTKWDERIQEHVPCVRSSKLDTKEFAEYMEWLVRYAAQEHGMVLPLPNDIDMSEVPDTEEVA